jgi:hypothetical protein
VSAGKERDEIRRLEFEKPTMWRGHPLKTLWLALGETLPYGRGSVPSHERERVVRRRGACLHPDPRALVR